MLELIKNVIRFSCTPSNGQNGVILNSDLTMENSEDFIRWRRLYMILVYSIFAMCHILCGINYAYSYLLTQSANFLEI